MSEYLSGWMSTLSAATNQLSEATQNLAASATEATQNLAASAQEAVSEISSQATRLASDLEYVSLQDITEKIQAIPASIQDGDGQYGNGNENKYSIKILPWSTINEEKSILCQDLMEKILALSSDQNTFLESPDDGKEFIFEFQAYIQIIMQLMEIDPNLAKMQSTLGVKVQEEIFWKNYFHRIELLRVEAGLEPLYSPPPPSLPPTPEIKNEEPVAAAIPATVDTENSSDPAQKEKGNAPKADNPQPANTQDISEQPPKSEASKENSDAVDILNEDFEDFAIGSDVSDFDEDGFIDADLEAEIALELEGGNL